MRVPGSVHCRKCDTLMGIAGAYHCRACCETIKLKDVDAHFVWWCKPNSLASYPHEILWDHYEVETREGLVTVWFRS